MNDRKYGVYRTIVMLIVSYGFETWSLTLQEEQILRMCVNMVLRRIYGPKGDEVKGEWRKLYNFPSSPKIKKRWEEHEARMGNKERGKNFGWKTRR